MARRWCDGDGVLAACRAAVAALEAHAADINALNVYPVPDGDTGSNMLATVRAALDEADAAVRAPDGPAVRAAGSDGRVTAIADRPQPTPVERVAAALSFGALMGARGNSGVITSQVLRGIADATAGKRRMNGPDLANALREGSARAYAAVARPVEGTILTVVREAAEAAVAAADADADLEGVLAAAVDAAGTAVARTPTMLPILRDAGVVDAGGEGFYRLLEGALAGARGEAPMRAQSSPERVASGMPDTGPAPDRDVPTPPRPDDDFGYETMFLVQPRAGRDLDLDAIRARFEELGESVLVAGDRRAAKVHVHSTRPDEILGYALTLGTLSRISVENLDAQAHDVRERRAAEFAHGETTAGAPSASDSAAATAPRAAAGTVAESAGSGPVRARAPLAVVAVSPGPGFATAFASFGAIPIDGGQGDNPSVGELAQAVGRANADAVLVLPNNANVHLAARRIREVANDVDVHVVPTRNAAEGVAALVELDPDRSAAENAAAMSAAAARLRSFQVTEAVRDAKVGDRKVKRGQTIVLDPDEGLVAADGDRTRALRAAVATLPPGVELVTLYYGDGSDLADAEVAARAIGEALTGAEVEVVHGGQPHYRYIISAE